MNRTNLARLIALLVALAVVVVVGAVAYHLGVTNSGTAPARFMPFRGRFVGWGYGPGLDLFGVLTLVLIGLLFFWLLAAILTPSRGGTRTDAPAPGDLERLRELSDMHDRGQLTDEEFGAAKRKLLGLP